MWCRFFCVRSDGGLRWSGPSKLSAFVGNLGLLIERRTDTRSLDYARDDKVKVKIPRLERRETWGTRRLRSGLEGAEFSVINVACAGFRLTQTCPFYLNLVGDFAGELARATQNGGQKQKARAECLRLFFLPVFSLADS